MKKLAIAALLLLLPAALYAGIVNVNDSIAIGLETALLEYPLPPDTELLDSVAIAGKMTGNGNGMQYYGMLLITSDLPLEQLKSHYSGDFGEDNYLRIRQQETQMIDGNVDYWFDVWQNDKPSYCVELSRQSVVGCEDTLWEALLNVDLRGH